MSNKSEERKTLRTDWRELPIDKELAEVLLGIANARAKLINFQESISDRHSYEFYSEFIDKADEKLMAAMNTIGQDLIGFECVNVLLNPDYKR